MFCKQWPSFICHLGSLAFLNLGKLIKLTKKQQKPILIKKTLQWSRKVTRRKLILINKKPQKLKILMKCLCQHMVVMITSNSMNNDFGFNNNNIPVKQWKKKNQWNNNPSADPCWWSVNEIDAFRVTFLIILKNLEPQKCTSFRIFYSRWIYQKSDTSNLTTCIYMLFPDKYYKEKTPYLCQRFRCPWSRWTFFYTAREVHFKETFGLLCNTPH